MIAEIPPGAFEIPDYALWTLAGWVLCCLLSGYGGYRWGLRSQREAEKLKARIEVLSMIDSILADMPENTDLWNNNSKRRGELRNPTFRFTCQLSKRRKLKIEQALNNYQPLFIKFWQRPAKGTPESDDFEKEYKALHDALNKFRDAVSSV